MLSIIVDRAGNAVLFYTGNYGHLLTLTYEEIE
jgi:hypothetical protein